MTYQELFSAIDKRYCLNPLMLNDNERILVEKCRLVDWGITPVWELIDRTKLLALYMKVCDA